MGVSSAGLVQARLTFSSLILLFWLIPLKKIELSKVMENWRSLILLGTAGLGMNQFLYFYSISKIPVGIAIFLEFLAPVFIVIYLYFRGQRMSQKQLLAVVLAIVGLAILSLNSGSDKLNIEGVIAGLLAAITFAFYSLRVEALSKKLNAWEILVFGMGVGGIFWNILERPFKVFTLSLSLDAYLYLGGIVLLGTILAFFLYFLSIQYIGSAKASLLAIWEPVFATLIAQSYLAEKLDRTQFVGIFLILLSTLAITSSREFRHRTDT